MYNNDLSLTLDREGGLPVDMLAILEQHGDKPWFTTTIPTDGAQAYKEGWASGDNPFRADDDNDEDEAGENSGLADAWDEAWDAAADAAQEAEDAEPSGSVVKNEYRIRYAEAGHPNHCGDWLAETLNNLILGKTHTDIDNFEALCNLNGVSLAKYKREGNGWQGRLRMTGRNLLARAVYEQEGVMKIPVALQELAGGSTELRADAEWMAGQRFKGKKKVDTVVIASTTPLDLAGVGNVTVTAIGLPDVGGDDHVGSPSMTGVPSLQEQMARRKAASRNKH